MNIKETLENVAKSLPQGREYADMRYYVLRAINESDNIEKKKDRKAKMETAHHAIAQQWKLNSGTMVNPFVDRQSVKNALSLIDEMIDAEKQKLEQLKTKPQKQTKTEEHQDDGTING